MTLCTERLSCSGTLGRAKIHFGEQRQLATITSADVAAWSARLQDEGFEPGTVLHHLGALSNLYRRARKQSPPVVPAGYDPVGDFDEKPDRPDPDDRWLEVPDAALLLKAAETYRHIAPEGGRGPVPFPYELVATFLLTGGRESDVLGLEIDDVSLDRATVTFRPNPWRRLKTKKSYRVVPLWPQLADILKPYFPRREQMGPGTLLFPSYRTGREAMLTDWRKVLDAVALRAGWKAGEIRPKLFRKTYTSAGL